MKFYSAGSSEVGLTLHAADPGQERRRSGSIFSLPERQQVRTCYALLWENLWSVLPTMRRA